MVTHEQRAEVFDYFSGQLGYRVLFIECECTDQAVLDQNYQGILTYSADYKNMDKTTAAEDLRLKVAHYTQAHEPMDEKNWPRITVDTGSLEIKAHKVSGHIETKILGYLGSVRIQPHTLYFSRVMNNYSFEAKKRKKEKN